MPKDKTLVKKNIIAGFNHPYKDLHSQYSGYHSRVVLESARNYSEQRTEQFLTHFSTALKTYYSSLANRSEIEVQIALVNSQFFIISSNKNDTAQYFFEKLATDVALEQSLIDMAKIAKHSAISSAAKDAFRKERHSQKFIADIKGDRYADKLNFDLNNFKREGKDLCLIVDVRKEVEEEIGNFLSGNSGDKKVMIVTGSEDMHAEQKILLALCKASGKLERESTVVFAGTFRPCRACFESLSLVRKFYLPNVQFGSRPGHFWKSNVKAHIEIYNQLFKKQFITAENSTNLFDINGLLKGLTETSHRPDLRMRVGSTSDRLHYTTDSDSDADTNDSDG